MFSGYLFLHAIIRIFVLLANELTTQFSFARFIYKNTGYTFCQHCNNYDHIASLQDGSEAAVWLDTTTATTTTTTTKQMHTCALFLYTPLPNPDNIVFQIQPT
jgi:hypothetical protein